MPSKYLLISRFPLKQNFDRQISKHLSSTEKIRYFFSIEESVKEVLELRSLESMNELAVIEQELDEAFHSLSEFLSGDIRRELLKFIESPLETNKLLPETKYIQLRHVEVPSENYSEYLNWRNETIFEVVKDNKDKITSFEAYHSLISGQPGVMFVSSFNEDLETYKEAFTNERYKEIIRQAGDSFITGGKEGLYTHIYQTCD